MSYREPHRAQLNLDEIGDQFLGTLDNKSCPLWPKVSVRGERGVSSSVVQSELLCHICWSFVGCR